MSAVEAPPAAPLANSNSASKRLPAEPEQLHVADQTTTEAKPLDVAMQRWLDLSA